KGRHSGIQVIIACHAITFFEGPMVTNSQQWSIWDLNKAALKQLAIKIATRKMPEAAMEKFISDCTQEDYSFAFINFKDPYGHKYYKGLDEPYKIDET